MTEGTVSRWNKKEGEAFSTGDILLQIVRFFSSNIRATTEIIRSQEYGLNSLEIRAELPGVLGKILTPEGSTNVPVEHVIALVAKDQEEFSRQRFFPAPPPAVRRTRAPSPTRLAAGARSVSPAPSSPRTPSAFRFQSHLTHESAGASVPSVRGMMMDHRGSGDQRARITIPASMCMAPLSRGGEMVTELSKTTETSRGNNAGWHQDTRIFNGLMD
ncbi:hypothetical protein PQX77_000476 [Marasmius sp. AFHP31]|nr:hypothetical protein PQX77_003601 [Marasmius sp. AFHP31]KAK1236272.1 hypothetical protein PQX77_000476 [Marasmius sp. AFHP31]